MGRKGPRDIEQNAVTSRALRWAAALLCIVFSGCGYTFATTSLTRDYATIAVPAFKNETFEENLQIRFNNILVREIEADGRLRLVNDPARADLVLSGALTVFEPHAISLVKEDEIGQFRISIVATASLQAQDGSILWRDEGLVGTDFYQTKSGRNREEAIDEALEELAERIIHESFDSYW